MPDPKQHARGRGIIESVLRYIPGFRGYLEKEYRRESDKLARTWMADQLQRAKTGLDDYMHALVSAAQIDALPQIERMRSRLDRIIGRLRGAMRGYSGFFDFVRIKEDDLDEVYDHDQAMMADAKALADEIEALPDRGDEQPTAVVRDLTAKIEKINDLIDHREDLLRGLGPDESDAQ